MKTLAANFLKLLNVSYLIRLRRFAKFSLKIFISRYVPGFFRGSLRILLLIGVFGLFSLPVFAQGTGGFCDLPLKGKTLMGNTNAGVTYFDAHTGGGDGQEEVDLSIALGAGVKGYAPGDFGHAACAEKSSGDTYKLKGWAWNDNLGFISFSCTEGADGVNNAGGGDVPCGSTDYTGGYGVTIEAPIAGVRKVTGYAWSPSFGWIEFEDQNTADAYQYGVTVDPTTGEMSGYAWTQAKVYMNFTGAKVIFTPEDYEPPEDEWCDGKQWLCVTVTPNPVGLKVDVADNEIKIADGVDGYHVNMSLMKADGVTPLVPTDYDNWTAFLSGIKFVWEDTVKKDQTVGGASTTGVVLSKPVDGGSTYFSDSDGDGVYTTTNKIRSYAPTSGGNISFTTNTTTPFPVLNENIAFMASLGNLPKNELILKWIEVTVPLKKDGVNVFATLPPVYPNGEQNMHLNFRPAMELGTLFVNAFKDEISGVRQIPENIRMKVAEYGNASSFTADELKVKLGYSQNETRDEGGDCASATFDVQFRKTLSGGENTATDKSVLTKALHLFTGFVDVPIVAVPQGSTVCEAAKAPYLVSEVSYSVAGKNIKYYSNHLPRISPGNIGNPAVIVHGNIYSQKIANVIGKQVLATQGNIFQKSIRNVVYKRIQAYFKKTVPSSPISCTVTALADNATPTVSGGCGSYYDYHEVGNEHVLYFKNANVTMDLTSGGSWTGKWVIVSEGGNIFIENNIYNGLSNPDNLVLISLLGQNDDSYSAGNIYLYPCSSPLRNIQAAMFADGALFSFSGDTAELGSDGVPVWGDSAQRIDALACQLKIDGSISTGLNTLGGADLDSDGRGYLLKGGGRIAAVDDFDARLDAQLYDLNYLRLFRLQVETRGDLPYDQKCGRALTADDIKAIALEELTVCGSKSPCDERLPADDQEFACDGINPFKPYATTPDYGRDVGPDGDAVPPTDRDLYAQGLINAAVGDTQFDPVYVFYDQSVNDSFVFQDEGSASITY